MARRIREALWGSSKGSLMESFLEKLFLIGKITAKLPNKGISYGEPHVDAHREAWAHLWDTSAGVGLNRVLRLHVSTKGVPMPPYEHRHEVLHNYQLSVSCACRTAQKVCQGSTFCHHSCLSVCHSCSAGCKSRLSRQKHSAGLSFLFRSPHPFRPKIVQQHADAPCVWSLVSGLNGESVSFGLCVCVCVVNMAVAGGSQMPPSCLVPLPC